MDAKKIVLKNSFLYILSAFLVKAIGFILLPIYTLFLSPYDYGIVNLVTSFTGVAVLVITFSLDAAVVRFYIEFKDDTVKLSKFYGTIVTFTLFSGILFIILLFLLRDVVNKLLFEGISFYPIILIALLSLVFIALHMIHQSILQGMQNGKRLTLINLVVFGLTAALNLFFIAVLDLGAAGILLAQLIVNIGYSVFMIIDLKKMGSYRFTFDLSIIIESLRYSIPLIPHNLSTRIAAFISRVFINNRGSLITVGLYSVASQFGALIDGVQVAVNKAFQPFFYEMLSRDNEDSKKELVKFSELLLMLYSLVYMLIGLFSQELVILLTHESYLISWTIIPIFVGGYSIKSIYYFYVNILMYYKNATKKLFVATLIGSLSDTILLILLYPLFGIYGAAFAFLIAKCIVVLIVVYICKGYNDIGYKFGRMLKIIIPSLLFMSVGLYFSYFKYIAIFDWKNFLFKFGLFLSYVLFVYFRNKKLLNEIIRSGIVNLLINKFSRKMRSKKTR